MKTYKARYELKNAAKDKLEGNYAAAVMICFLASFLSGTVSMTVSLYVPYTGSAVFNAVVWSLLSLTLSGLLGVLDLGITLFFLNASCGRRCAVADLFRGFRLDAKKALTVSGARALVSFCSLLPLDFVLNVRSLLSGPAFAAAAAVSLISGIGVYLYAGLGTALSFFLMLDFPDLSGPAVLRRSFRLIRGNRMRLLLLQLSFLPMTVLCVLSLFIGFLWLTPYRNMTYACFFLDLMNPQEISSKTRCPLCCSTSDSR